MTRQAAVQASAPNFIAFFVIAVFALFLLGVTASAQNPVPYIAQPLVPDCAAPGGPAFTVTVNGTGFVASSVVNWNGSPRATTFLSSSKLTATILASDIAVATTATITVVSPSTGNGTSNPVFFPINTPEASLAFSSSDFGTGPTPYYATTADFRRDGNLDLAVANFYFGPSSVSVLLGTGNGTFQSAVDYDFSSGPQVPIVGDFNGDGIPDLAVGYGLDPGFVGISLGNGDGTFQSPVSYPTQNGVTYGFTADLNGDGKLDLVIVNQWNNSFSVLLGNGDGTFQPQVAYNVGGSTPTGAAPADLNGDGILDIVVSNWGSNNVSVLLGNGDGAFQPAVTYPVGSNPGGVNIADVNGDGILDLIVPNQGSSNVSVLLGKGDGTFAAAVNYPVSAGAVRAEFGDFNLDGKLDVAVVTYKPSLDILLGNGDGTFQPALSFPTLGNPWNVVVADFNQDGRLDAAVPGASEGEIAVMLQTSAVGTTQTTTTLTSSLNPSNYGQSVTFTATVTASSGTPTGSVIFYSGSTQIGSATLSSSSAAISTSSLPAGSDPITAAYQGSSSFAPSTSPVLTQVVNGIVTTTSVVSSLNPSTYGQSVTFTVTVTSSSGAPTGNVTLSNGATVLGSLTLANGMATFALSSLPAGSNSITAAYQGSGGFNPSTSSPLNQVVNLASTVTALTSSINPVDLNHNVTYTATITTEYGAAATGTVTFQDNGVTVATAGVSNNQATFTTSYRTAGVQVMTAAYSGDSNNQGSVSAALSEDVGKLPYKSTTTVTTSGSPLLAGQAVTFTATVTSADGAIPNGGTVTFYAGSEEIGTGTTNGGVATFTTSTLAAKTYTIKATYSGDAIFKKSSGTIAQVVTPYSTTTTLTSSLNPSTYGQTVNWTATVTSTGPNVPTGKLKFAGIGEVETLNGNGVATYSKTWVNAGTHAITAEYEGDDASAPSDSATLDQVVNPAATTTVVTSSPNPSSQGQSVTFTATVTASTGATVHGKVTFTAGGTTLGTVALSDNVASISTSALSVGTTVVQATYNGNVDFTESSGTVSQTVNP